MADEQTPAVPMPEAKMCAACSHVHGKPDGSCECNCATTS